MNPSEMSILKERIEYANVYPERIIIGDQKQIDNPMIKPMFTEKEWTKILTKKSIYVGENNG